MNSLSQVGERGLIIFDEDSTFKVVTEDSWRAIDPYSASVESSSAESPGDDPVRDLVRLGAALASLEANSAFVDLDKLAELPATKGSKASVSRPRTSGPVAVKGRSVVLKEGDNIFVIPEEKWVPIRPGIAGDARVLVTRGAVVAAVPQSNVPSGTFCVLVNFVGLAS